MMNLAKDHIENKNVTIDIIDTKIASLPLYFIATKAARLAIKGKKYEEIYKRAIKDVEKANIYVLSLIHIYRIFWIPSSYNRSKRRGYKPIV